MSENLQFQPADIQNKIFTIRGQRVMIDRDLAEIYGVETRVLNQAVKRNMERFPEYFMFQMTENEFQYWKSQIVISNSLTMSLRKNPPVCKRQSCCPGNIRFPGFSVRNPWYVRNEDQLPGSGYEHLHHPGLFISLYQQD